MEIENFMIDFPCPECEEEFKVSLYQLQDGGVVFCPKCQSSNVENEMVRIARQLDELGQSIQNLKKCMNEN